MQQIQLLQCNYLQSYTYIHITLIFFHRLIFFEYCVFTFHEIVADEILIDKMFTYPVAYQLQAGVIHHFWHGFLWKKIIN